MTDDAVKPVENETPSPEAPEEKENVKKRPSEEISAPADTSLTKEEESPSAAKRSKPSDESPETPLDLAVTMGYKAGDRIEVQWEIHDDDGEVVQVRWWGATLMEHDGKTTDSVAIRKLDYDPCPDMGFPERSIEEVVFMGDEELVSPDSATQLKYRREGEEDGVFWCKEESLEEKLNSILMGALSKNEKAWKALPPAQRVVIAEKITQKKNQLISELRNQDGIITSSKMSTILQKTMD